MSLHRLTDAWLCHRQNLLIVIIAILFAVLRKVCYTPSAKILFFMELCKYLEQKMYKKYIAALCRFSISLALHLFVTVL